jgi:CheY-like chemotaxis protein
MRLVSEMTGRRLYVVVAEPSPILRQWLIAGLAPLAVEIAEVETGRQLVTLLEEQDRPVDLVVVAERLPGPGGAAVLAALRGAGQQVPVLLVAPFIRPSLRSLVERAGRAALLDDPLDTAELRRLASELAGEPSALLSGYGDPRAGGSHRRRSVG